MTFSGSHSDLQKKNGASRSMSNQVYLGVVFDGFSLVFQAFFDLGGLKVAKTFQDAPRRSQDAPRGLQDGILVDF